MDASLDTSTTHPTPQAQGIDDHSLPSDTKKEPDTRRGMIADNALPVSHPNPTSQELGTQESPQDLVG